MARVAVVNVHKVFVSTGSGAISLTTTETRPFRLKSVSLHVSSAPVSSGNFTVNLVSVRGSTYNKLLYKRDLQVIQPVDLEYIPQDDEGYGENGDQIKVEWANADGRTYVLRVLTEDS